MAMAVTQQDLTQLDITQLDITQQLAALHAGGEGLLAPADWPQRSPEPAWSRAGLSGRLCELSAAPNAASAVLTAACDLILDTQHAGEPVAWITTTTHIFFPPDLAASGVDLAAFFPPDLAASGVDLAALILVRVRTAADAARAADRLLRSGAFGLVVLDLSGGAAEVPIPLQGRLVQLALAHDTAVLCLTEKEHDAPSLGSLVSLHGRARRRRLGPDRFAGELEFLKDKRHGPGWTHRAVYRGPDGLR